ncbi:DUF1449 family protein [Paraneptunicella aestuarii]|uniref:OB-fold-containig protein n=1 Tax=Paraneptunicella aestuarii TaxID=2831148 RepID=UPI001E445752|nr:OB-fold-containig protein [Paraneptunicella aestuarii]UAA39574.1 DUF1449 family protein [Paraneptunicella aestuarii]
MFEFFTATGNLPYTFGLFLVLGIALIEGVGLLIGLSVMSWIDELTPFDLDVDADADVTAVPGFMAFLGWLCLSKLPLLVWLILFIGNFSVAGYIINYFWLNLTGDILWQAISVVPALLAAMYLTHLLGGWIAKIMPNTTTDAVSVESFQGTVAVLVQDGCRKGRPVEASMHDSFGTQQQVLVELVQEHLELNTGAQVVLTELDERGIWRVIPF